MESQALVVLKCLFFGEWKVINEEGGERKNGEKFMPPKKKSHAKAHKKGYKKKYSYKSALRRKKKPKKSIWDLIFG
jgi:hypothetical protein